MKQSSLERTTNAVMLIILLAQGFLALVSDVLYLLNKDQFHEYWYIHPPELILHNALAYWLSFFVLFSNLMPISLYPTMEICNAAQSHFIRNDKKMYYRGLPGGFPAVVRNSNLCQELGQVNYVFSDKTGTLTQ